jgi:hypothetical protein
LAVYLWAMARATSKDGSVHATDHITIRLAGSAKVQHQQTFLFQSPNLSTKTQSSLGKEI